MAREKMRKEINRRATVNLHPTRHCCLLIRTILRLVYGFVRGLARARQLASSPTAAKVETVIVMLILTVTYSYLVSQLPVTAT